MFWLLIWLAVGGLTVGLLGRLTVSGPDPLPWPRTLLLGLIGALGGGLLTSAVLGRAHDAVSLLVSVVFAALLVAAYAGYRRVRALPPR